MYGIYVSMYMYRYILYVYAGGAAVVEGDETVTLSLGDCLSFFTGAEQVPPAGFDRECTLNFNSSNIYPTASTCALVLTLPTMYYDTYDTKCSLHFLTMVALDCPNV